MAGATSVTLRSATWPADRAGVAALFREYEGSLTGSLLAILCFQGFEQELTNLPGAYAPPRGDVLLAELEGALVGVGALRPLELQICEMKRLYVQPAQRGTGLGERLAVALMQAGRHTGYRAMRLDTHVSMATATALYRKLGFREIPPYSPYPAEGLLYFERAL